MKAIIGKKVGMTGIFDPKTGKVTPCTLVEAGPCIVTQIKTTEKEGYNSVQLGFQDKKDKQSNKSEKGHFAKSTTTPKQFLKEFRNFISVNQLELGQLITLEQFAEGEEVEVVGTTKGKGFQGVVKRHGFSGVGQQSHGQHDRQRAPGSVGGSSFPSRVFKGMRMAGRMGGNTVKVRGLKVLKVLSEKNYLVIEGCVPGFNGSIVYVQKK